ncbi:porin family protein [Lichenihabitans sp. Uapishka_5]|uniref:outer membrane protein n=1 Tax=Lichenihabitans sp. Uapishka_5 TaxID=3037302 RepID=UPI0029E805FA|nr:porin family protein [Lichenihabitans sp. Uapishka_5]MDX7951588.1 porin family protein [Lichenihabitans sp. Uapishka_5]
MKKILTAAAMLVTMSGVALAADLPSRAAPPVYAPPPVPVFTWSGAYFGINAGYAFDNKDRFRGLNGNIAAANSGVGTTRPALVSSNSDGFTGGGQIGYNYQIGGMGGFGGFGLGGAALVIGVEADAAYTDLTHTRTVDGVNTAGALIPNTYRSNLDFLGTVRGRVGLAFNQFMIYGTGGFAYGGVHDAVTYSNANGSARYFGNRDRIETGYAYGGGVEYALPTSSFLNFFKSSAVTLKVEYLRYDLGNRDINLTAVAGGGGRGIYVSRLNTEGNIVRAGLNYKFGSN